MFHSSWGQDDILGEQQFARRRDDRHINVQGLLKFALVVPIFLVLLFGMEEVGGAWMTKKFLQGPPAKQCEYTRSFPRTML